MYIFTSKFQKFSVEGHGPLPDPIPFLYLNSPPSSHYLWICYWMRCDGVYIYKV